MQLRHCLATTNYPAALWR